MAAAATTDRFVKIAVIQAPRPRVWRAISDAKEFGAWFGIALDAELVAGTRVTGKITDPPGYDYLVTEMWVERVVPERELAFRWHPFAIEKGVDYSHEPTTLVELHLDDVDGATRVTITESGFDALPPARRAAAFAANGGGWEEQLRRIERHVTR